MAKLSPDERSFHQAIESGSVTDLQNIMKKITNSRDDKQRTPLHKAVAKGDTEIIKYLIDNEAELNAQDVVGRTPLYDAAVKGNIKIAKMLIEKEVKVNTKTKNDFSDSPLHAASFNGHTEVAKFLIENGG